MTAPAKGTEETSPEAFPTEEFLDRLMAAESGGRLNKKNPRSTALGPFQFIESTFLFVVNKQFPSEVAGLTEKQVLALRTNLAFSRRAARAYTNDLISALKAQGLPATTVNVRIAFLVGPAAAVRLLKAPTDEPLKKVLSADAIAANPFMSDATVGRLVQKAAAEVSATAATRQFGPLKTELAAAPAGLEPEPADTAVPFEGEPGVTLVALEREPADTPVVSKGEPADAPVAPTGELRATTRVEPAFEIKCEIGLASCRKWIAQQEKARLLGQSAQQ